MKIKFRTKILHTMTFLVTIHMTAPVFGCGGHYFASEEFRQLQINDYIHQIDSKKKEITTKQRELEKLQSTLRTTLNHKEEIYYFTKSLISSVLNNTVSFLNLLFRPIKTLIMGGGSPLMRKSL